MLFRLRGNGGGALDLENTCTGKREKLVIIQEVPGNLPDDWKPCGVILSPCDVIIQVGVARDHVTGTPENHNLFSAVVFMGAVWPTDVSGTDKINQSDSMLLEGVSCRPTGIQDSTSDPK